MCHPRHNHSFKKKKRKTSKSHRNFLKCKMQSIQAIVCGTIIPAVSIHELPRVNRSIYRSMGIQADEIFEKCTMYDNGIKMDCALNFHWIPVFDLRGLPSNCYALNSLWGNATVTRKIIGRKTVFILMLKGFEEHLFYERIPRAYQVMVHSSYALVNPFVGGFSASRCYDYFVYISMVHKILQPFPYSTNCTDYITLWYERDGKSPLNQNMCTEECILNISLATDNCVNSYNSVYPTDAMACRGTLDYDEVYEKCHNENCNPACNDENFIMNVQEVKHASEDTSDVKSCSTKIVISFERMEEIRFEYIPKYESIELFSYVGGYLGVWLGISLIAVFEFVECLVVLISVCALKCGKVSQRKRVFTASTKYDNHFGRVFGDVGSVTIY
ncbi:uncharacterized protein LOC129234538 [Uloborus diversus]|uniref:uncharacterized protein LOC129234538 n=1 Tax=Uloborus diversus TaxID=327109 RepID=UPI0024094A25|nr:uncharacterized protein LOC129234538 [Uloborus diversus]